MKKSMIFVGLLAIGFANAQEGNVGINTDQPKATLDIQPNATNLAGTTNEGILAPKLSKDRIAKIATPVEGTLVYATDNVYAGTDNKVAKITEKGYYFYNGTEWVKTSATDSGEWIYDSANKRINLKRSNSGEFKNEVYFDEYGNYVNKIATYKIPRVAFDTRTSSEQAVNYNLDKNNWISATSIIDKDKLIANPWGAKGYTFNGFNTYIDELPDGLTELSSVGIDVYLPNTLASNKQLQQVVGSRVSAGANKGRLNSLIANAPNSLLGQEGEAQDLIATNNQVRNYGKTNNMIGTHNQLYLRNKTKDMVVAEGTRNYIYIEDNQSGISSVRGFNTDIFLKTGAKPTINTVAGFRFGGIALQGGSATIKKYMGIEIANIEGGEENYAIHAGTGKVRFGDLAQTGAGDRVVYADENGVLKTGVSAATNVKLATANNVECTEANTGTMNFGSVTINGKATEAFGFCMKNSTGEYKWYYIYGGAGITTGSGAFGSNL